MGIKISDLGICCVLCDVCQPLLQPFRCWMVDYNNNIILVINSANGLLVDVCQCCLLMLVCLPLFETLSLL